VFNLLQLTIDKCPNLKYVVLEQLGNGLKTMGSKKTFYNDFLKMEAIVKGHNKMDNTPTDNDFLPTSPPVPGSPAEDGQLYQQQLILSEILETASSAETAIATLSSSALANSDWLIESWEPYMIDTAMRIAQKWKK
jgi:hypothetical protein